jgi:hypothetical protein
MCVINSVNDVLKTPAEQWFESYKKMALRILSLMHIVKNARG